MSQGSIEYHIRQLQTTLGKMEVALDSIFDAIIWTDSQGKIQWCNRGFAQLIGRPAVLALGSDLFELMPLELEGRRIGRDEHPIHRIVDESKPMASVYHYRQPDRLLALEISISSVDFTGSDSSRVVVFHDVTEQQQAMNQLQESQEELRINLIGTIGVIGKAVEARDPYTSGHQQRVSGLARAIAQEMGLDHEQVEWIRMGAAIHDIGKIHLPAEILSKPGRINEMEYELIKTHAQVGYEILKDVKFPWPIADIAHQHHERLDGSGYPQGLKGKEICLEARIVAVADVLEAMSSHRPYRPAIGIEKALDEITGKRGKIYDPDVVDACLRLFKQGRFAVEDGLLVDRSHE